MGKVFARSFSLTHSFPSPLFVPMLFMIQHSFVSLAQLLLVCFLTTKNLFQITWCCFDMSSECRNRCSTFPFSCSFLLFKERLWLWQGIKRRTRANCDVEEFFVRHQMWLMVVDFLRHRQSKAGLKACCWTEACFFCCYCQKLREVSQPNYFYSRWLLE